MTDWTEIVSRFGPVVWATAYRLLGRHDDALDCYQETFLAAVQLARRQEVRNWPATLKCLAVARAVDQIRRRAVRPDKGSSDGSEALPGVPGHEPSPPERAQAADLMAQVRRALSDLPPQQAQVFWLRCVDGLSYEEIGRALGVDADKVGVLLHRARAHLRNALGQAAGTRCGD